MGAALDHRDRCLAHGAWYFEDESTGETEELLNRVSDTGTCTARRADASPPLFVP